MGKATKKRQVNAINSKKDGQTKISSFFENKPPSEKASGLFTKVGSTDKKAGGKLLSEARKDKTLSLHRSEQADFDIICIDDDFSHSLPLAKSQEETQVKKQTVIDPNHVLPERSAQSGKTKSSRCFVTQFDGNDETLRKQSSEDSVRLMPLDNDCKVKSRGECLLQGAEKNDTSVRTFTVCTPQKGNRNESEDQELESSPEIICDTPQMESIFKEAAAKRRKRLNNRSFLCRPDLVTVQPGLKCSPVKRKPQKLHASVSISFSQKLTAVEKLKQDTDTANISLNSDVSSTNKELFRGEISDREVLDVAGLKEEKQRGNLASKNDTQLQRKINLTRHTEREDRQQHAWEQEALQDKEPPSHAKLEEITLDYKNKNQCSDKQSAMVSGMSIPETQIVGNSGKGINSKDEQKMMLAVDEQEMMPDGVEQEIMLDVSAVEEEDGFTTDFEEDEGHIFGKQAPKIDEPSQDKLHNVFGVKRLLTNNFSMEESLSEKEDSVVSQTQKPLIKQSSLPRMSSKSRLINTLEVLEDKAAERKAQLWINERLVEHTKIFHDPNVSDVGITKVVEEDPDKTPVKTYPGETTKVKRQAKPGVSPASKRPVPKTYTELKEVMNFENVRKKLSLLHEDHPIQNPEDLPFRPTGKFSFDQGSKGRKNKISTEKVTLEDDKDLKMLLQELNSTSKEKNGNIRSKTSIPKDKASHLKSQNVSSNLHYLNSSEKEDKSVQRDTNADKILAAYGLDIPDDKDDGKVSEPKCSVDESSAITIVIDSEENDCILIEDSEPCDVGKGKNVTHERKTMEVGDEIEPGLAESNVKMCIENEAVIACVLSDSKGTEEKDEQFRESNQRLAPSHSEVEQSGGDEAEIQQEAGNDQLNTTIKFQKETVVAENRRDSERGRGECEAMQNGKAGTVRSQLEFGEVEHVTDEVEGAGNKSSKVINNVDAELLTTVDGQDKDGNQFQDPRAMLFPSIEEMLSSSFTELSPFKTVMGSRLDGMCDTKTKTQWPKEKTQQKDLFCFTDLWQRFTVQEKFMDREKDELKLTLKGDKSHALSQCVLTGFWVDTAVEVGDIVNVLGEFTDGVCVISDRCGLLVVNPDLLLSGTVVVSSLFCYRKSVLNEKFRGIDNGTIHMLHGSIIHSLFQTVIKDGLHNVDAIRRVAQSLLSSSKFLHDMYGQNVSSGQVMEVIERYIPSLAAWLNKHTSFLGSAMNSTKSRSDVTVTGIHDIEENIWSPRFGIKGKIDLTVKALLKSSAGRKMEKVVPLELKTGKSSFSSEHKGQVTLYSMMSSDRREDPEEGILLYLEHGDMQTVTVKPENRSGLIQRRNELADFLSQQVCRTREESGKVSYTLGRLPPPINNQSACSKCNHLLSCSIYQRTVEQVDYTADHAMSTLVPATLNHLDQDELEYWLHWCLCLDLETQHNASGQRGQGGQLSHIWRTDSLSREESGECLSHLTIHESELGVPETQSFSGGQGCSLTFIRHHEHKGTPLDTVGLTKNDMVVVSSEDGRYIALATGFIRSISDTFVEVAVDRDFLHDTSSYKDLQFRLDRNVYALGNLYTNLARLMEPDSRMKKLRELIIKGRKPHFNLTISKNIVYKVKSLLKLLNPPQKTAIFKVLMSTDYVLITGFPGTGKTSTIVALVKTLQALGQSVLLTSFTHSAVDNILLKLKKDGVRFLRLGRQGRIHRDILPHCAEVLTFDSRISSVEKLEQFYNSYSVVATSCLGVNHPLFSRRKFDVCIVDEASQVLQPVCLGPLFCAHKFVLVGDPRQLPPLVANGEARSLGMEQSLYSHLESAGATFCLHMQYRMNSVLMNLSNKLVYNDRLTCGRPDIADQTLTLNEAVIKESPHWVQQALSPVLSKSIMFLDTQKADSEESSVGKSVQNKTEADIVFSLLDWLIRADVKAEHIGVISPYRSQVKLIKQRAQCCPLLAAVEVNTVDQYQGRDKSVILISFVRSNKQDDQPGELLKDLRRLNVALTRAKHKLILIGNSLTLQGIPHLQTTLELLHQTGCISFVL